MTDRAPNPRSAIRLKRRAFLGATATGLALPAVTFGQTEGSAFSFDLLTEEMKALAETDYAPPKPMPERLAALDYDAYRRIRFQPAQARWRGAGGDFQLHAFHPGWLFNEPVEIFEIVDG
ncbi:MAG: glucan biosynthesis protein, partial [Pseudomonadota bacterium]